MAELLPLAQAETIKASLLEYLGTTFALADPDAKRVLDDFLQDGETGMFRGPYVRLRLPFRPAAPGWRESLQWYEGPAPYGHQAAAFARLSSFNLSAAKPRPQPTLVTTGTGSGKTEAFLYPILDHVRRAKRAGHTGTKALILYPMNALANDQAARLATLLTRKPALGGITAALYTGEAATTRSIVSADGLITDREIIRDTAPDILLTNYKMLDQLLLRPADAPLWRQSATSLQYLVLDEFHTYDGAQGTDVSMLLRRLGHTLKSYWRGDEPGITAADRARPLGRITPVATSATLGDGNDPAAMLGFAHTVFGDTFTGDAVVTESRLTAQEWAAASVVRVRAAGLSADDSGAALARLAEVPLPGRAPRPVLLDVLAALYGCPLARITPLIGAGTLTPLDLLRAHPAVHRLIAAAASAAAVDTLGTALTAGASSGPESPPGPAAVEPLLTALSHVRATDRGATDLGDTDLGAASVEVHLWARELTRVDRAVSGSPRLRWGDDGVLLGPAEPDTIDPDQPDVSYLPAVYCRHCNRSGWGVVLAPTGADLDPDDTTIRRKSLRRDERYRALIHAPREALDADAAAGGTDPDRAAGLAWLMVQDRRIEYRRPDRRKIDDGLTLPVLINLGEEAGTDSARDTCPSCRQPDGIRFLGSAIATMLSVSLSTLLGTPGLDDREKRALVFTDSVQDAAHRAGFVQARSHALTLRTLIRQALGNDETDLDSLSLRMLTRAGDDPAARYRLLPPELAERGDFANFWTAPTAARVKKRLRRSVTRRLMLDIALEFGLRSGVGRTLERTGTALAYVDVPEATVLAAAREVIGSPDVQIALGEVTDAELSRWVHGVLTHLRQRGAIAHPWFERFRREDGNRWSITGGRQRSEGMPGFGRGSSAPGYPTTGKATDSDLEPIAAARGWYAGWTAQTLRRTAVEGGTLARLLFERLHQHGALERADTASGAHTYALAPSSVIVRAVDPHELAAGSVSLRCSTCRATVYTDPVTIGRLAGAPCLVLRCDGTLGPHHIDPNFYRQMYASTDIRRVVAREHTSLLDDATRITYEEQFKMTSPPPDAPNVLVATPTLEMGIDIGDLSAVLLSSLPKTVASYLQRVGRAGRLTGNALALAYVTARGDQLPRFTRPGETINGTVRPPATYLDAEEILRRQFVAFVADVLARRADTPHPRTTADALRGTGAGTYLGALIAEAETRADQLVAGFLAAFPPLGDDVTARLRGFPTAGDGAGTSPLARRCHEASREWNRRIELLGHRLTAVQDLLAPLRERALSPARTSDDESELRTAEATVRLLAKQLANLRSEYWISALETFGLFPNYTLLDDTVTLAVSVNWRDPETDGFEHRDFEIGRGSAQALRDFAPGSTFYANGFAIAIDAVDLGIEGEQVHEWACCAGCGFVADLSEGAARTAPSSCPRCRSKSIADTGQRLPVVELKNVSSVIRREEAAIDDARDERSRQFYSIITAADIDPAEVHSRWFVDGLGFGVTHARRLRLRWLNLGTGPGGGSSKLIAGVETEAGLFRVCRECGKLDHTSRSNRPSEHRPWCSLRTALEEETVSVALARTMTTEALVLRLPATLTLGDSFAVPSLSAALLLGLRERLGGSPDHLQVATIAEPAGLDATRPALLLHDTVPGGTGYLADLAHPDAVWDLLRLAWDIVRACECKDSGKLACERCLLPFANLSELRLTSRAAAAGHLTTLLTGIEHGPDDPVVIPRRHPWRVSATEPEVDDGESDLEKRFRVAFRGRLEALGATITEKPTDRGVVWDIALGSTNRWTLRPQENVLGSKPDFVLTSVRGGVPPTAIFTDGWRYHASASHNRLADDAEKRRNLRDGGYQVVAVTRDDVDGAALRSSVLRGSDVPRLLQTAGDRLAKSALDLAFGSALDLLTAWVQDPSFETRKQLAHWVPFMAAFGLGEAGRAASGSAIENALARLNGAAPASKGDLFVGASGSLAFAMRLTQAGANFDIAEVAVVLDDDTDALSEAGKASWREWLHWSNLLNFRARGAEVSTRRHAAAGTRAPGAAGGPATVPTAPAGPTAPTAPIGLTGPWLEAYESTLEQALVKDLAAAGVPVPVIGEETADGIPLEVSWPGVRVAADLDLTDADRAELAAAGWAVCAPDVDTIRTTLQERSA